MTDFAPLAVWGDVRVEGPLSGGARSRLWRVTVDGRPCVARCSGASVPALFWLQSVLRAAERADLAVAPLIPAGGRLRVAGWTVEPFLQGIPATRKDLPRLAAPLARFHRATATLPQRPGWHMPLPSGIKARVAQAWPEGPQAVIHGDIHPGNVLRLPTGQLALLDWEEARRDSTAIDHAALIGFRAQPRLHAAVEVLACWQAEPARARQMARRLRNWT